MWNTVTTTQITQELLPDEVATINTIQGSDTILAAVMASCIAEMQMVILNAGNQIGQPGTLPDQIMRDAIAFIRWEWLSGLPQTGLQSDARKEQAKRWEARAARIRGDDGKPREKIEIPTNPQAIAGADNRVEVVRTSHQRLRGFDKLGET